MVVLLFVKMVFITIIKLNNSNGVIIRYHNVDYKWIEKLPKTKRNRITDT